MDSDVAGGDPQGQMRVSTADREAAVEQLTEQWRAGRLDPAEHEARITQARSAVTRSQLDALFTDLPEAGRAPVAAVAEPGPTAAPGTSPAAAGTEPVRGQVVSEPLGGRQTEVSSGVYRAVTALAAISPFLATALFFLVGNWVWFLLIPASWALRSALSPQASASHQQRDERRAERRQDRDQRN